MGLYFIVMSGRSAAGLLFSLPSCFHETLMQLPCAFVYVSHHESTLFRREEKSLFGRHDLKHTVQVQMLQRRRTIHFVY